MIHFGIYSKSTRNFLRDGVCAPGDAALQYNSATEVLLVIAAGDDPLYTKMNIAQTGYEAYEPVFAESGGFAGPLIVIPSCTVATLPDPVAGGMTYVTDASGGACFAGSTGVSWYRITLGSVVS